MGESELIIMMWFFRGVLYGLIMMSTIGLWIWAENSTWLKHDNRVEPHGADTYLLKRNSTPRLFFIVIAGMVWPLALALVLLYGLFRIPILIYKKTGK